MPEGDSVYRQCAMLRAGLKGQVIESSDFRLPGLATSDVAGRTVLDVVPRGKHLLIRLSAAPAPEEWQSGAEPLTLHSHLMMDGTWRVFDRKPPAAEPAHTSERAASSSLSVKQRQGNQPFQRYASVRSRAEARVKPSYDVSLGQSNSTIRVVLRTATVEAVAFDVKDVQLVPTRQEDELVGFLGPDTLGPDWDGARAVANLRRHPDRTIASAIMDQRNLAGVGNVYRVEVLFMTRTHPWTPVRALSDKKLREIVDLSQRLLELNKNRPLRSTVGEVPRGRPLHWVYGRRGQACLRCHTPLEAGVIDDAALALTEERSVTDPHHPRHIMWCPRCQKELTNEK